MKSLLLDTNNMFMHRPYIIYYSTHRDQSRLQMTSDNIETKKNIHISWKIYILLSILKFFSSSKNNIKILHRHAAQW